MAWLFCKGAHAGDRGAIKNLTPRNVAMVPKRRLGSRIVPNNSYLRTFLKMNKKLRS